MKKKVQKEYSDFSNVTKIENELIPEEFPEGPFGAVINHDTPVSGKSSRWKKDQQRQSAFVYADKDQHLNEQRNYPNAHLAKDNQEKK